MHILIKTKVHQSAEQVMAGFNESLFKKLAPPFPPVKLLRFDGSQRGDRVILELNFIFFRQTWESVIVHEKVSEEEISFTDEGAKLPFFLRTWQHHHRVRRLGDHSQIIDDIHYQTPNILLDYLMYPLMYLQFFYRKPIYQKIFNQKIPVGK